MSAQRVPLKTRPPRRLRCYFGLPIILWARTACSGTQGRQARDTAVTNFCKFQYLRRGHPTCEIRKKKPQVRRLTPERRGFCLHFGSIVFEALFPGFTLSAILPARLSAASGSRVLFLESLSSIGGVAGGGRDHLQTKALRWSLRSPFAFRGGRFFSPARRLKSYWPMKFYTRATRDSVVSCFWCIFAPPCS